MCLVGERARETGGDDTEREREREDKTKDGEAKGWERRNLNDRQGGRGRDTVTEQVGKKTNT